MPFEYVMNERARSPCECVTIRDKTVIIIIIINNTEL